MSLRSRRRNERRTRLRSYRRPKLTELPDDVILIVHDHLEHDPIACVLCQMMYRLLATTIQDDLPPSPPSSFTERDLAGTGWLKEHYGFWDSTACEVIESRMADRLEFCAIYGRGAGFRSKVNRMKFTS